MPPEVHAALFGLTRAKFREQCNKVLAIAGLAASWTPIVKDDQVIVLLSHLVNDPDAFDKLCDLLGFDPDPV